MYVSLHSVLSGIQKMLFIGRNEMNVAGFRQNMEIKPKSSRVRIRNLSKKNCRG